MYELLNVLHVTKQGAVLHLEHGTVRVELEGATIGRFPLLRLAGIVVFGRVTLTPFLIHRCAEDGRSVAWLDRNGRFKARLEGPSKGNVLLRRAQHLALSDRQRTTEIARQIVAGKIQNSRQIVMRAAREAPKGEDQAALIATAEKLARILRGLRLTDGLDVVRGCEGDAARAYFGTFRRMLRNADDWRFDGRQRRPPRDRINAMLSFVYALLRSECAAGAQSVGLDAQVGYLHALRPGRDSLALDLMEELRSPIADRLVLTLVNRRQVTPRDFDELPGGAIHLNESGRRTVLTGYQQRKTAEVRHRTLKNAVPLGLVPHVQARLLARHLRGDLAHYPPFIYR